MNHEDRCHIEIERRIPMVVWPIASAFGTMLLMLTLLSEGIDIVGYIDQAVLSNLKFWIGADLLTLAWVLAAILSTFGKGDILLDIDEGESHKLGFFVAACAAVAGLQAMLTAKQWTDGLRCGWYFLFALLLVVKAGERIQIRSTGLQIPGRFIPWKRMISYRVSDSDTLSLKFKRPLAGPAISLHMQLPKDIATQVHHAFVAHGVQFRGGSSHSSN